MFQSRMPAITAVLITIVFFVACERSVVVTEPAPKTEPPAVRPRDPYLGAWVNITSRQKGFKIEREGDAYVIENEKGEKFVGTKTAGVLRLSLPTGSADFVHLKSSDHLVAAGDEYKRFDPNVNYPIRASVDMRSIGTSVEAYAADHPAKGGCTGYPTGTIQDLTKSVVPTFINRFPDKDSWGYSFYYRTDGCDRYVVVSGGSDGKLFSDVESDTIFGSGDPKADDIVFTNARFVRVPPGY